MKKYKLVGYTEEYHKASDVDNKKITIVDALERIDFLIVSNNKFKPSIDNISEQRAGYIQALKDVGMLKR